MNSKILVKYIIIYIPFLSGIVMYNVGAVNLLSSLLVFLGGYIAIKNTFDYRVVRKNIQKSNECIKKENNNNNIDTIENKEVVRSNKLKRDIRVRKRIKK